VSADLVRIFKKKWRTESGLKMIHRNMHVDSRSDLQIASGPVMEDTLGYFDYEYTERIYSAYGIVASSYKRWKYQVGLRLEQSFQEPNLLSENLSFKNDYFNFFPSGTLRYSLEKKGEFSLGYSRRINRPNADNLNPFTSYADPFNLRRGNPELRPEYIHSIDLGYEWSSKKVTVAVTAYQRYANNVINRVKVFYSDGTSAGTFANIDNSVNTGGELVLQYRPLPIWRNMLSINSNYIKYTDNSGAAANFNREGLVIGGKMSSTLELMKRTLTIQVNGRYAAPSVTPSGRMKPRGSMDFSIDKSLKEGKWGVGLRVSDIFDTQGFQFYVDQPNNYQNVQFKWETRRLFINVRYKFGKTEIMDKKRPNDMPSGGGGMDF
jgi:outer membrane receptor protein involved in Fe transport